MGALELGDRSLLLGRSLGVLDIDALGLLLDLDLECPELVVPSRDAVVLPKGGGGAGMCLIMLEAEDNLGEMVVVASGRAGKKKGDDTTTRTELRLQDLGRSGFLFKGFQMLIEIRDTNHNSRNSFLWR